MTGGESADYLREVSENLRGEYLDMRAVAPDGVGQARSQRGFDDHAVDDGFDVVFECFGDGIDFARVDIYLARPDDGEFGRLIGNAVTNARGHFAAQVTLPRDLELAAYQIYAATPGDKTWRRSISR